MKTFLLIFTFSLFGLGHLFAQRQEIDSLKKMLPKYVESDTNYINILNELAFKYYAINPDSTLLLADQSIALCQKKQYDKGKVEALKNRGIAFWAKGDYTQSLNHYLEALPLAEKINYTQGIGRLYNNIALIYRNQGKYPEALENYFKALHIREKIGDKKGIAASLNNIGLIYYNQVKYPEALENYFKALSIMEKIGDKQGIAYSLNNIALVYEKQGKYAEASENQFKSLKIKEEIGDDKGIAMSLNNLANIYNQQNKIPEALEAMLRCLKIYEEIGDKRGISHAKDGLAEVYMALKNDDSALHHAKEGLVIAQNIGEKEKIRDINKTLSKIYKARADYALALQHYENFKTYSDSLYNSEVEKKTANLQAQYEFDKKAALMQVEQAKKDLEQEKQRQQLYWLIFSAFAGLFSLMIVLFLIFRSRKKLQQVKEAIEVQAEELQISNQALQVANQEIQRHNKEVEASINAAFRIQTAMLPFLNRMDEALGKENYFILYKPRDIVSGDFYFFEQLDNQVLIAVADCTGHGVPGAFMSMIGINFLEDIVKNQKVTSPSQILYLLNQNIRRALKQDEQQTREGMDMNMIRIDKEKKEISFAGAINPLYYIPLAESLQEIKATKKPIGGMQAEEDRQYAEHTISFAENLAGFENPQGLTLYLCTDGYQDQFGGEKNRKFMVGALKKLLFSIQEKPMNAQSQILNETIENWRKEGNEAQIDDITILGLRLG